MESSTGAIDPRRTLPSIDMLLRGAPAQRLIASHGRTCVAESLREVLDDRRAAAASGPSVRSADLMNECAQRLGLREVASQRSVINLSGTVVHTNLGRSLFAQSAAHAAFAAMTGATNLEFDLAEGGRGERDDHVESLLRELTGAEAATVVNNNAAAVLLALNTVAARREVVVSRGELVEIGGAFRIPDVMAAANCKLREVGTTNRTHLRDYEDAVSERTAAIMKVHASNYVIVGFTAGVAQRELTQLARARGIPFFIDLGSGSLIDLTQFGLPHEPTAREAIADGADAVTFSGDKLLGGPQCGIIVGSKALVGRMRANPLKRALRVDKITLAALEATLRLYRDPDRARREVPTLRLLTRGLADIQAAAQRCLEPVRAAVGGAARVSSVECLSQVGSGSQPVDLLPSHGLLLKPTVRWASASALARHFRALPVPVVGRVQKGAFMMDMRCLEDEGVFMDQLRHLRISEESA